jgi:hypothetical protein
MQNDYTDTSSSLVLNPRYIKSGFGSQSANIKKYQPLEFRKLACYMRTVSQHILKHGHNCFASSETLLKEYNDNTARYGVPTISKRTIGNLQVRAEKQDLIRVSTTFDKKHGVKRRIIKFNLVGIKKHFKAVYNFALNAARNFCGKGDLHLGGSSCEEPRELREYKVSQQSEDEQNYRTRSKILSNDRNIKNNGSRRLAYDDFLIKYFGGYADEVKSLQEAARNRTLKASGAKRLIELHNRKGYPVAPKFKKYLDHIIAKAHSFNKTLRKVIAQQGKDLSGNYCLTDQEAIDVANRELMDYADFYVWEGLGEVKIDRCSGVAYYREFTEKELHRNAILQA